MALLKRCLLPVEDGPARDENVEDEEAEIGGRADGYAPLAMDVVRLLIAPCAPSFI